MQYEAQQANDRIREYEAEGGAGRSDVVYESASYGFPRYNWNL